MSAKTAGEIMHKDPAAVRPDTTVEELGRLFIEKGISGAVVVDAGGKLFGVVTENDLISRQKQLHIPTVIRLFDAYIPLEGFEAFDREVRRISGRTVEAICAKDPVTVAPTATIDELATIMTEKKVHHLPVVVGGKLVGLITQHDVLRAIAASGADDKR